MRPRITRWQCLGCGLRRQSAVELMSHLRRNHTWFEFLSAFTSQVADHAGDHDADDRPRRCVIAIGIAEEDDDEAGDQDDTLEHEPWDVWLRRRGAP